MGGEAAMLGPCPSTTPTVSDEKWHEGGSHDTWVTACEATCWQANGSNCCRGGNEYVMLPEARPSSNITQAFIGILRSNDIYFYDTNLTLFSEPIVIMNHPM